MIGGQLGPECEESQASHPVSNPAYKGTQQVFANGSR